MTAVIAAVVSVIASGITLFIGLHKLKNERDKLQIDTQMFLIESKKFATEQDRFQAELRESARQARVWEAEIERLRAETNKLAIEADEFRRRRLAAERGEIRDLLILFDRSVFDAPMQSEEPVEMFKAIRQTRIALQMSGASLVRDREVAEHFQKVRETLLIVETEVAKRYPVIVEMANQLSDFTKDRPMYERRKQTQEILGKDYYEPVRLIMNVRREISHHIDEIRNRLRVLDDRIGS